MLPRRTQYKMQPQPLLRKNMQLPLPPQQQPYTYWSPPVAPAPPMRTSLPMPTLPVPPPVSTAATSPLYESPIGAAGTPRKWVGVGNHHQQRHGNKQQQQQRNSTNEEILVEHQQHQQPHQRQQQSRPRMGLAGARTSAAAPVMTSTPQLHQQQQQQQQQQRPNGSAPIAKIEEESDNDDEEEPIYCEIARSCENSPESKTATPAVKPALMDAPFASVQRRGGSGRMRRDRQVRRHQAGLAGDFSQVRITEDRAEKQQLQQQQQHRSKKDLLLQRRSNKRESTSGNRKSCDLSGGGQMKDTNGDYDIAHALYYRPVPGLGRRAATQIDMVAPGRQRQQQYRQQHQQQHLRQHQQFVSASNRNLFLASDTESVLSHPMGFNNVRPTPAIMNRQQQQRDDLYSDYGFGSGLDDTASSVATSTTASSNANANNLAIKSSNLAVVRKGLLWQQRAGLFSRWKERYLVLTPDYLNCFRRSSSTSANGIGSEMGGFAFKVRLAEVESVELADRRGYLTVVLAVKGSHAENGEGGGGSGGNKILLRKPEGIREWYNDIKDCVQRCKERRGQMKSTKEFWSRKQFTDSSSMEQWLMARRRIESKYAYSSETDSVVTNPVGLMLRQHNVGVGGSRSDLASARGSSNFRVQTTDYGFIDSPAAGRRQQQQQQQQPRLLRQANAPPAPNMSRGGRASSRSDIISDCSAAPSCSSAASFALDSGLGRSSVSPTSSADFCPSAGVAATASAVNFRANGGVISRDTSSTFSHDSGVDSMNTNSSGSVMSRQTPTSYATTVLPQGNNISNRSTGDGKPTSSSRTPSKTPRPSKILTLARQRPISKTNANSKPAMLKQNVQQHQASLV